MGPLKGWLTKLYSESTEFRDHLATKNGNALADYVCTTVEAFSPKQGKPWKRHGPSSADKKGKKDGGSNASSKGNDASPSTSPTPNGKDPKGPSSPGRARAAAREVDL